MSPDDPTFIPQINPISDELDNRMKMMQGYKERWQTLYELGQKKKEDMDILRKNYQDMKEQEDKSCTFKPQIYSKNYESESRVSIAERTKMWAEGKQKKIEMLKEQMVDKDIDECTFQPALPNNNNYNKHS